MSKKMGFLRNVILPAFIATTAVFADTADEIEKGKKFIEEKAKEDGVVVLPSGLAYKSLNKGKGKAHPTVDSPCSCHYKGTLIDGTQFDSSYDRGEPTTFAPNQVIKGWTEAMQLMVEGDKWEMYIPYDLAYGEHGSPPNIPGGATLVFTMEIIEIQGASVPAVSCDPYTFEDCDEKEKEYAEKWVAKKENDEYKFQKEQLRLVKMVEENKNSRNLSKTKRVWLETREKILTKIKDGKPKEKKEEL